MKKIFLTDIDDVVLDWTKAFSMYMKNVHNISTDTNDKFFGFAETDFRKLTREFNNSQHFGTFPSYKDSVTYMKKLHKEYGFVFIGITSCLTEDTKNIHKMKKLREQNIEILFGGLFKEIHYLGLGQTKSDILHNYKSTYFVDDMLYNCVASVEAQHTTFQMINSINSEDYHENVMPVSSWKQIYQYVKNNEQF